MNAQLTWDDVAHPARPEHETVTIASAVSAINDTMVVLVSIFIWQNEISESIQNARHFISNFVPMANWARLLPFFATRQECL